MMKRIALILLVIFWSSAFLTRSALAQGHYCDTPTLGTGQQVVGVPLTLSTCADGKDVNGNPTAITSIAVYDNGVKTTPPFVKGTTSTVSGKTLYTVTLPALATAGVHTYQVTPINASGEQMTKSTPFVLTVSLPPTVPTVLSNLTVQ